MQTRTMVMTLPTGNGTIVQAWLRGTGNGRITLENRVEFTEDTDNGYRQVFSCSAGEVLAALNEGSLPLRGQDPGLTIARHWLTSLADWVEMFTEWSSDVE